MNKKILYNSIFRNRYSQLVIYKAYADLIAEANMYFVGYAWWVVIPIFDMLIYYIVFGLFFKRATPDYVPFLLTGILAWRWFYSTIMAGSNSIIANKPLMNRVFMPKFIFPSVVLISNTFKFVITLLFLFIFLWFNGYAIGSAYLALPLLFIIQFMLIASFTYIIAAILPFYPDLKILIDTAMRFLFFLSGIFYSVSTLNPKLQLYLSFNPMVHILDSYRDILIYSKWPDMTPLSLIGIISLIGIFVGYNLTSRFDHYYPKIL